MHAQTELDFSCSQTIENKVGLPGAGTTQMPLYPSHAAHLLAFGISGISGAFCEILSIGQLKSFADKTFGFSLFKECWNLFSKVVLKKTAL
jgi:hypothetical protein